MSAAEVIYAIRRVDGEDIVMTVPDVWFERLNGCQVQVNARDLVDAMSYLTLPPQHPESRRHCSTVVARLQAALTLAVNARKDECVNGHALIGDNVKMRRGAGRYCVTCHRERVREAQRRYRRRRAA